MDHLACWQQFSMLTALIPHGTACLLYNTQRYKRLNQVCWAPMLFKQRISATCKQWRLCLRCQRVSCGVALLTWCAGAMVLASPWGDVCVILQMQRGNLEGFNPRLLTLAAICDALESGNYSRAWDLTVTNRVDLNLLVDYAWPRFLDHAEQFVSAVQDPSDLCDLFFALQQSSVLQQGGMYASLSSTLGWQQQHQAGPAVASPPAAAAGNGLDAVAAGLGQLSLTGSGAAADAGQAAGSGGSSSSNKVSAVCEAIRAAVLKLPGRYLKGHLKTVVMSYAK